MANNPPTVEAIPNSICYATGIFSYSLIIEDLDDDDIDVTGTSGIDLSYDEFDVSQPVSGTFTGILTVSDGINTARTDLTLIFKAAPYIKTGYTSIVCYVDYLCIVKITDMINTDDYFDIDSDMFFMESSDYFYNTFNVASTVETYNIGIYYDDYCMVDIVHELTTNYILAISSITAE